jgi:hypothetical protein
LLAPQEKFQEAQQRAGQLVEQHQAVEFHMFRPVAAVALDDHQQFVLTLHKVESGFGIGVTGEGDGRLMVNKVSHPDLILRILT